MAERLTLEEIRERTYKRRDAWWTVWLVDPLASRLVRLVAPYRAVTPNRLTMAAFLLGGFAAACFAQQDYPWLVAGAVLFHFSFVIDCMDGKVARLNGTGSAFGGWLDYVFDRLRVLVCAVALMGGQFAQTGSLTYLWVGGVVVFLDMFRYLNALQMGKVKSEMRSRLAAARGAAEVRPALVEQTAQQAMSGATAAGPSSSSQQPVVDVFGDFRTRFSTFVRIRNVLIRQRIRAHVFSGIEFQMVVFIIGPLTGFIIGSAVVASVLLVTFELLLIYKMWMTTRTFQRQLPATGPAPRQADASTRQPGVGFDAMPVS